MRKVFHVGELVIMQRATRHTQYNGLPAVVIGGLARRRTLDLNINGWVTLPRTYRVRVLVEGAPEHIAEPYQLRRLRDGDQKRAKPRVRRRSKTSAVS
jgi:acylphosphatase